jgi:hypothetical protein
MRAAVHVEILKKEPSVPSPTRNAPLKAVGASGRKAHRIATADEERRAQKGETKMKSRKKAKVAVAAMPQVVSQYSIIEERVARQELVRAFEKWSEKHNTIRDAIAGGAEVEKGLYRASVALDECVSPIFGLPFSINRLTIS